MRNKNGMTLVALIITVIIMMILAGIVIVAITGDGLFRQAGVAVEEQRALQADEMAALWRQNKEMGWETRSAEEMILYMAGIGLLTQEDVDNLLENYEYKGAIRRIGLSRYIHFNVGRVVGEGPGDNTLITIWAQPGDRVNYDPSGYPGQWVVLHNDGTNVSIISMSSVRNVTLAGLDGYHNAVSILNGHAQDFMNEFAQSARSVGSPVDGSDSTRPAGMTVADDGMTFNNFDGNVRAGDYAIFDGDEIISFSHIDITAMQILGISSIGEPYWLGYRAAQWFSRPPRLTLSVGGGGNALWHEQAGQGPAQSNTIEAGLRPVITLRSDVLMDGFDHHTGFRLSF